MISVRTDLWTAYDVPSQRGRVAVITGGNTGLGFQVARVLAARGASIILAVRNVEKGIRAAARIHSNADRGNIVVQKLDLASLESVRAAAAALNAKYPRIDLLINNAGVMHTPKSVTRDGFELQFGTNHLGHFALTGLLLKRMLSVAGSRVVTVSSIAHRVGGKINFDNLQSQRSYDRLAAYAQSKLANLMFTYELERRLFKSNAITIAVAAHPGNARTDLYRNWPRWTLGVIDAFGPLLGDNAMKAALPILRAATDPTVLGGEYYGPGGFGEFKGYPTVLESSALSHDEAVQNRLWQISEQLTGIKFPV